MGNIFNGILQYILILHYNLGIPGAAASYVISMYLVALLVFIHIRFSRVHVSTAVEFNIELISELFHTAKCAILPMIQTLISTIVFNVFPIVILLFICHSKQQLALYSIMYSLWFIYSLLTLGYGTALTVRIGHLLGAKDATRAKRSAIIGVIFGELVLLVICIGTILLSRPLSHLFTTDINFGKELYYNLLLLPVTMLSDIMYFVQGIMNACGMSYTQAVSKFIFLFVLGFISEYFLTKLVTWKALCLFSIQALANFICFSFGIIKIFSRSWDMFVLEPRSNLESTDNVSLLEVPPSTVQDSAVVNLYARFKALNYSRVYIFSRYIGCMLFGYFVFVLVYLLDLCLK